MKPLFILGIVLATSYGATAAKEKPLNVINYYAVGNSLDGQLFVEMQNVLRFYPVFAMRDSVKWVHVTVYYGSNIFTRQAEKMDLGKYWEVSLPQFKLGEAIQRIEVETFLYLRENVGLTYIKQLDYLAKLLSFSVNFEKEKEKLDAQKRGLTTAADSISKTLSTYKSSLTRDTTELSKTISNLKNTFIVLATQSSVEDSIATLKMPSEALAALGKGNAEMRKALEQLSETLSLISGASLAWGASPDSLLAIEKRISELSGRFRNMRDFLYRELVRSIEAELADTNYAGPSVRRSDIILSEDLSSARILYRNYKTSLRRMPALDPAERLGIFRVRYIPFLIVGRPGSPRMSMAPPFTESYQAVFEIGLAFGDAIVPGDEFVVPEFSVKRLGVAFAITKQIFSSEAEIIGLALTYDFNSYGSIGIGGNFAKEKVHGYASFGVNKKAFEQVVAGLGKLFE